LSLCRFRSRTSVLRLCVACAMFTGLEPAEEYTGVAAPSEFAPVAGRGVDAPELFCVASTEASFRCDSEMICLVFLFRRVLGFQLGLRKGLGV
jgi:hypothetical protein